MQGLPRFVLGVVVAVIAASAAQAAPPWAALFPFQRIEADPQKSYSLTQEHGPWLILCATFGGENGRADAQKLVLELRRDFQLEAFLYAQNYDFNGKERGLGYEPDSTAGQLKPKMMKYLRDGKYQEWAVMVGHFPGVEDPTMQATLQTIKHAQPKSMESRKASLTPKDDAKKSFDVREMQRFVLGLAHIVSQAQKKMGPMATAFATRNPLLPKEEEAPAVDSLVLEMNQDAEFSLLNCPGKYSVRVATFRGRTLIDQKEIDRIERGGELSNKLEDAARRANRMATALRARGVDAYEFHDRVESIVCVGSFDSIGTPRADGKIEMSAAVRKIMDDYGATSQNVVDGRQNAVAALKPKSIVGIPYDVQPWPVTAPKAPIAATVFGSGLFR